MILIWIRSIGSYLLSYSSVTFLLLAMPSSVISQENRMKEFNIDSLPNGSRIVMHGTSPATHAVVWLHGLGATADDFPPIVPELGLSDKRSILFVFPQAPIRPITINGGMSMPGWYDIKGISIEDKQDAIGMAESQETVNQIIDELIEYGISSKNIVLAGFSQGGAVTYFTGVRSRHELAGLLTLSTYLPFESETEKEQSGVNLKTPIFASHGSFDPVVPIALGEMSVSALTSLGYNVRWQVYPMEHQVAMEQIQHIGEWFNQVFSRKEED